MIKVHIHHVCISGSLTLTKKARIHNNTANKMLISSKHLELSLSIDTDQVEPKQQILVSTEIAQYDEEKN